MIPEYFALVGAGIASLGGLYYLYCTIKGTVKPHRMTWFFWTLFPMVAFVAQLKQDVGMVIWITFASGFLPLMVFIAASFNPKAYWKIQKVDYLFALIGMLGIVLWYLTDNANLAITFSIIADFAVAIPTIIKTFKFPETETWKSYALNSVGFGLGVFTITEWTYENYSFVVFLLVVNVFFTILAARKP